MRWTGGAGAVCGMDVARSGDRVTRTVRAYETSGCRGAARLLPVGLLWSLGWSLGWSLLAACSPTVRVEPPEKPIVINMNVKIEHEIRVKVDKDLERLFEEEDELF